MAVSTLLLSDYCQAVSPGQQPLSSSVCVRQRTIEGIEKERRSRTDFILRGGFSWHSLPLNMLQGSAEPPSRLTCSTFQRVYLFISDTVGSISEVLQEMGYTKKVRVTHSGILLGRNQQIGIRATMKLSCEVLNKFLGQRGIAKRVW